jgi:hypothetical protein
MGTSLAMIDATYDQLAPDADEQEAALLDTVDAAGRASSFRRLRAADLRRCESGRRDATSILHSTVYVPSTVASSGTTTGMMTPVSHSGRADSPGAPGPIRRWARDGTAVAP